MVDNSTNINKTKETNDSQQFPQNKTKESLNSDGQQFLQFQQNKRNQ